MNFAKENDRRWLLVWYGISLVIIVADLMTKKWASEALFLHERVNVLPVFDITLRHNYGMAFSFLANQDGWQVWFLGIVAAAVSVGIIVWIARIGSKKSLEVLGLSLILGGAIGNLYDRVTLGYVVDFILVYYQQHEFPAFNIADSAITVGAGVLLVDAFVNHKKENGSTHAEAKVE